MALTRAPHAAGLLSFDSIKTRAVGIHPLEFMSSFAPTCTVRADSTGLSGFWTV